MCWGWEVSDAGLPRARAWLPEKRQSWHSKRALPPLTYTAPPLLRSHAGGQLLMGERKDGRGGGWYRVPCRAQRVFLVKLQATHTNVVF